MDSRYPTGPTATISLFLQVSVRINCDQLYRSGLQGSKEYTSGTVPPQPATPFDTGHRVT